MPPKKARKARKGKLFEVTSGEEQALAELIAVNYPFPATTEVAVFRKMLRDVWKLVFPDRPFPKDKEDSDTDANPHN